MDQTDTLSDLISETLLLRTAIAHARQRLAAWLEPDGMSGERCLDELLELFFHPALDESAAAQLGQPCRLEMLRQAVRDSRSVLLRHFGEGPDLAGEACLNGLLIVLDNRSLVAVGGFADLFEVEVLDQDMQAVLLIRSRGLKARAPTLH